MLVYLCLVITLNLCIGYALGAYFGPPPGLRVTFLRDRLAAEPLVRPVAEPLADTVPPAASAPAPAVADASPRIPLTDKLPGVTEAEVLWGLEAFQRQLAELGQQLDESQEDSKAFGQQANKLQEASQEYLRTAHEQIEKMNPAGECRQSISDGVEMVDKSSKQYDALLEEGVEDATARRQLVEKTAELTEKVGEVKQDLHDQFEAIKQQRDASTGLATLDGLLAHIEEALAAGGNEQLRTAALIRTDPTEHDLDPDLAVLMQEKLAELLESRLAETGQAARLDEGEYLLLMEEAELEAITRQIDDLRQEIAQTTFARDEQELRATVTCAVADLPGAKTRDAVLERLEHALAEANNHGHNHTFHHDGNFATMVDAPSKSFAARTVEL